MTNPAVTTATGDADAVSKVEAGQVALVAIAPDGTNLWAVRPQGGRTVYFSSRGTQASHSESCGKNCTRTIDDDVPMADTGASQGGEE